MEFTHGAEYIRVDFHLHTKADKQWFEYKGEENDFVKKYVQKLKDENVQLGVITNHNKFDKGEYDAIRLEASKVNIFILPGVELNIADGSKGIHTLIVFSPEEWLQNGNDYINKFLITTSPVDDNDFKYKNGRSKDNFVETLKLLKEYNKKYFIILAHVNQDNGFFEELKSRKIDFGNEPLFQENVLGLQKVRTNNKDILKQAFPNKLPAFVEGSDPKNIEEIGKGEKCYLKLSDFNFEAVKFALIDYQNRGFKEIPKQENAFIKSIKYIGGKLDGKEICLNASMNNLIGIRGSGKSSVLETIRYALDIELTENTSDNDYKNGLIDTVLGSGGEIFVEIIDKQGDFYIIQKRLNENSEIYKDEELVPNLKPEHLINQPLYFGQKDLSSIGDIQTTKAFISRLVGKSIIEYQQKSDETAYQIRTKINSLEKINKDLQKETDVKSKIAELELKIENFKKFGIVEKLEKETVFNKDESRINHVKKSVKQLITDLSEFIKEKSDFENLKNFKSKENQDILDKLTKIVEEIEKKVTINFIKEIKEIEKFYDKIKTEDILFKQKKETLLEEFSKIKRDLKLPAEIKADDYQKFKTSLENYNLQLKELEKKAIQKKQIKTEINNQLKILKQNWKTEFDIIYNEIEKVNNYQKNVQIKPFFKGDKENFAKFIRDLVRGSNIRMNKINELTEQYEDLIDLYLDFENEIVDTPDWFEEQLYNNLSDFLTYRVPNTFEIEYNGKPLINHSLGQRASALIVFLLSLHENDLIMIDQPEDDLDSQTIYNEVISELKKLKNSTQFIFATHNPNIPVLGDCEQVLVCDYDSINEKINVTFAGIDNKDIQQKIVDIMEGGKTAFEERKIKYSQWKH